MKPLKSNSPWLNVQPQRAPGFLPWDNYDNASHRRAITSQPYQAGDVIQWKGLDRGGKPVLCTGLLVDVGAEYFERRGHYCAVFFVRPQRKDGGFALAYLRVWPGDIERGESLDGLLVPIKPSTDALGCKVVQLRN
ncbi:hypothetical protein [Methylomonas methanica]|uniref:Uncharacterized protein n=1 Tax=Methylomonas methanica TaxID=421 RepID=A0A177MUG0_METMH|nr:hypothetical protein [Methylomonas methanica]OAI09366.1 hypothetical protein A1332_24335 [Methylomonas methanica]